MRQGCCLVTIIAVLLFLAACSPRVLLTVPTEDVAVPNPDRSPSLWYERYPLWSLKDSLNVEVLADSVGNKALVTQVQWFYINKRTPNYLEEIIFSESRAVQEPMAIQATAYYPDNTFWQLREKQLTRGPVVIDHPTMALRSTVWHNLFLVPRYQSGMILRVATQRVYHKPQFTDVAYMRTSYAAVERSVVIKWPKGYTIQHRVHNGEGLSLKVDSTDTTLTLTSAYLDPILTVHTSLQAQAWYAGVHYAIPPQGKVSYDWARTAQDYYHQLQDTIAKDSLAKQLSKQITPQGEFDTVVQALFDTVQAKVRYLSRLDSLGAFLPRSSDEVLRSGYGDCKESSLLLYQLLRAHDISTFMALTSLGGGLQADDSIAGLRSFDHLIVGVVSPAGDTILVDPTNRGVPALSSSYPLLRRRYLPLGDDSSITLKTITPPDAFSNRIVSHNRLFYDSENQLRMQGRMTLTKESAARIYPSLIQASKEERKEVVYRLLQELFELSLYTVELRTLTYDSIVCTYEADMRTAEIPLENGGIALGMPSLLGGHQAYNHSTYDGPVEVIGLEQIDTWELPEGYRSLTTTNLPQDSALCTWEETPEGIKRTVRRSEATYTSESALQLYRESRDRIMQSTVWRKP